MEKFKLVYLTTEEMAEITEDMNPDIIIAIPVVTSAYMACSPRLLA